MPAGGQEITGEQGGFGNSVSTRLRSRKTGTGTAEAALTGQQLTGSQGALGRTRAKGLTGTAITGSHGTLSAPSVPSDNEFDQVVALLTANGTLRRAISFSNPSDLGTLNGNGQGFFVGATTNPVHDPTVFAHAGGGSIKFRVTGFSSEGTCGEWYTNYAPGSNISDPTFGQGLGFGANTVHWVRWDERVDQNMIDIPFRQVTGESIGIKTLILSHMDGPNANPGGAPSYIARSDDDMKLVTTTFGSLTAAQRHTINYRHDPTSGSDSSSIFQNAVTNCNISVQSGCRTWVANEFQTHWLKMTLGQWLGAWPVHTSQAVLTAPIGTGAGITATVGPTGIWNADYSVGGLDPFWGFYTELPGFGVRLKIDNEILEGSRPPGSNTFTLGARGQRGTTAASHAAGATVTISTYFPVFENSGFEHYIRRPGQARELVTNYGPSTPGYVPLMAHALNVNWQFGKFWFGPFMTNKDPNHDHPEANMWLADIIIAEEDPIESLPARVSAIAEGTIANVSENTLADVDPCPAGTCTYSPAERQGGMFAWCSGSYVEGVGPYGYLCHWGGGHNAYYGNETYKFDLFNFTWTRHKNPGLYGPNDDGVRGSQFWDHPAGSNIPVANGRIYLYAEGTTTYQAAYQDEARTIPVSQPIILTSGGVTQYSEIWGIEGLRYKIELRDSSDNILRTIDQSAMINPWCEYKLGEPATPHTYRQMHGLSPSLGGGTEGSLVQLNFGAAGAGAITLAAPHIFDYSTNTWSRYGTSKPPVGMGLSPSCLDKANGKFYCASSSQGSFQDRILIMDCATRQWSVVNGVSQPATQFPGQDDGIMEYCPDLDVLVFIRVLNGGATSAIPQVWTVSAASLRAGVGTPWVQRTTNTFTGVIGFTGATSAGGSSINWASFMGKFAIYNGNGESRVHYLTPPSVVSGTWLWSFEDFTGATPATANNDTYDLGYSRFTPIDAFECFAWYSGVNSPVQLWKPRST
jgi:hypothetical protein